MNDLIVAAAVESVWRLVRKFLYIIALLVVVIAALVLSGCASKPVIQTQVIDRPVPVFCNIAVPAECKDAYAVDRVSVKDDPLTINRTLRQELEERAACEVMLRAAVLGCNKRSR